MAKKKAKVGPPTKYGPKMLEKIAYYVDNHNCAEIDDRVPTINGLAYYIKVVPSTIHKWRSEKPELSDTLDMLKCNQARLLENGGLSGEYNATISKLMLHNHGYSDKQEVEQTSTIINMDSDDSAL